MRWKQHYRKCSIARVAARLQQQGQGALPGPLWALSKYRHFQVIYKWAMLGSNQRPPPCKFRILCCVANCHVR